MALLKAGKKTGLKPEELKWSCDPAVFEFESTSTLKPIEGIIGQERAVKALKMGVDLKGPGYNVFITGLSGTGKFTTLQKMLEKIRPQCPQLYDYLYVNNFREPDLPLLLTLPAGMGKQFRTDMEATIKFLQKQIPQELEENAFVNKRKELLSIYGNRQQSLMASFERKLEKNNFTIGKVKINGAEKPEILPIVDGKPVFISQLDDFIRAKILTKQKAKVITEKYSDYQQEMNSIIKNSLALNREFQDELTELENRTVSFIIKGAVENLRDKYKFPKVHNYLELVEDSVYDNLDAFKVRPNMRTESEEEVYSTYLNDYEVNIILDNSNTKECPVVIETNPTFNSVFGSIEKVYDGQGGWQADFTKIKAGSILRANGGYLVINAIDAFTEPGVWKTLKRVMLYDELEIQDVSNAVYFSPSSLKPEKIEMSTKIIMIGNNEIYSILSENENDFNKIFKVKAEFDHIMKRTDKALTEYAQVIKKLVQKEKLKEFSKCGIAKITEYGARYAGRKDRLTTRFAYIADLAREASYEANDVGAEFVTEYHVNLAYNNGRERHGLYESKMQELYTDKVFLIDTHGTRVGQINGLAVYGSGMYDFGKPARITATVSLGNGNILNVEREAGLSGKTHNKGMLIITGYLRESFGQNIPLSFNASIVFEQGYGPIDGDSASIAEITALISSLSKIPIKQGLAVTGSVNQKGDVQPIGGVNEKIEGYFDVCKHFGLNKEQGVVIPIQNVNELMLKDEVIEAVKAGMFNIYPVARVEEAIEILMGVKAGKLLKNGKHEPGTVFGEVEINLLSMKKKQNPPKREPAAKKEVKKTVNQRKKK